MRCEKTSSRKERGELQGVIARKEQKEIKAEVLMQGGGLKRREVSKQAE